MFDWSVAYTIGFITFMFLFGSERAWYEYRFVDQRWPSNWFRVALVLIETYFLIMVAAIRQPEDESFHRGMGDGICITHIVAELYLVLLRAFPAIDESKREDVAMTDACAGSSRSRFSRCCG